MKARRQALSAYLKEEYRLNGLREGEIDTRTAFSPQDRAGSSPAVESRPAAPRGAAPRVGPTKSS